MSAGKDSSLDRRDFEDFRIFINNKVDTMTAILESFKIDLTGEGVARYKLGQDLERVKNDATRTKGRLGAMEVQAKEIGTDLDNLVDEVEKQKQMSGETSGQRGGAAPEDVGRQLTTALDEIEELSMEMKDMTGVVNNLRARIDAGAASTSSGPTELTAADYANRISSVNSNRKAPEFVGHHFAYSRILTDKVRAGGHGGRGQGPNASCRDAAEG